MDLQLAWELEDSRAYAAYLRREVTQVKRQVNATQRLIEESHEACDRMSRMLASLYACGFGADRQQNNEHAPDTCCDTASLTVDGNRQLTLDYYGSNGERHRFVTCRSDHLQIWSRSTK